jgi:hypothetical protein
LDGPQSGKKEMFDLSDDEYDYGMGAEAIIDPDALFLSELMEIENQIETSQNSQFSHFPRFLQQPSQDKIHINSHSNFSSKEGKLIVNISDIQGLFSSSSSSSFCQFSTIFGTTYECIVTLDDLSYHFVISPSSSSPSSLSPSPSSSCPSQDLVFDVFEYFGGMILKIILIKKTFFREQIVGEIQFSLHDLVLAQERWERQVDYLPLSTIREQHSHAVGGGGGTGGGGTGISPGNVLSSFWGYQSTVKINPSSGHQRQGQRQEQIKIRLSTRYIPLQSCLSCSSNSRYYNQHKSELHHICMTGSAHILTSVIELLARKNCLKLALSCRESVDGLHGYNALELALVCRNISVAKVLLQRAGNLCFGGINSTSSLLPMVLLTSPFDHLGILHQALDLSSLLRDPHSSSLSSVPHSSATLSPSSASSSHFIHFSPHTSTVATTSTLPSPPTHTTSHPFQTQHPLSPEEILLYTGGSPVHIAILGGFDCLQLLVSFLVKYSSVVTGWEGVTTLGEMIEYTANRYDDLTPFMLACLLGDERSAKLLFDLKKSPPTSAPTASAQSPPPPSSQQLISLKYPSKFTGYTPLMLSCYSGNVEILKLFLSSVEPIDNQLPIASDGLNAARHTNSSSRKVLEKYFHQESPVSLLSCAPLARDYQGRQAITFAAMCGHVTVVQLLIQRGVPYMTCDVNGMTPLHYGAYYGHKTVCDLIIQCEYYLTLRFESFQQNQTRRKRYSILKGQAVSKDLHHQQPESEEGEEEVEESQLASPTSRESRLMKDSDEYYSYQFPMNKTTAFASLSSSGGGGSTQPTVPIAVKSLNFMTRRPNALLRMDLFGNRPADIAIRRCFSDIAIRLHIAVLEIYGMSHPPTYSNTVNSEPLVLGLIEEKQQQQRQQSKKGRDPFCRNGGNVNGDVKGPYQSLSTDKSSPLHSKLSSMIPRPFHFLPLRGGSNSHLQSTEKQIALDSSVPVSVPVVISNTSAELDLVDGGSPSGGGAYTSIEQDEWTRDDEWAVEAAYNFATILSFPTPPPSPTTISLRRPPFDDDGDGDEKQ